MILCGQSSEPVDNTKEMILDHFTIRLIPAKAFCVNRLFGTTASAII
jgi:hypothetical protein